MSSHLTSEQIRLVGDAARELDAADACSGERGAIVARLADTLKVSVNTVYSYLKRHAGWSSGKKPRKGKGQTCVPQELCRMAAGIVLFGARANGKKPMTLKMAVRVLKENGKGVVNPVTGEITMPSVETISRAMRQYGCHPDQLSKGTPSSQVRSLHPNHVWELDASVCVLYYIRGTKRVGIMDERKFNEKKPANLVEIQNKRVVRYIVVDHASGVFYLHYEQAAGENAQGVLRTLINFAVNRGHQDPAHGLPRILYMDPGSGNASSLVMGFCEQLEIRAIHHKPGEARATGAVEQCHNLVECQFESRLRFMEIPDLASLQKEADRWRRHFCATAIHSRTKVTRNGAWLTIQEENLRIVEKEILEAIAAWKDVRRQVGSDYILTVDTRTSFGTQSYDLSDLTYHGLGIKDSVRVRLNPFKAPEITVVMDMPNGEEKLFNVKPIEKDRYGFNLEAPVFGETFRSQPDGKTDTLLKQIKKEAFGAATLEDAEKLRKSGQLPYTDINIMADIKDAPLYLGRTGQAFTLDSPTADPTPMSRVAFAMMMQREHADVWHEGNASECMEWLVARYPDSIPGSDINTLIAKMREHFAPSRATIIPFERSVVCQ